MRERNVKLVMLLLLGSLIPITAFAAEPIHIGNRRELFVDKYLIDHMDGVELRLQKPVPREVVIVHDAPW